MNTINTELELLRTDAKAQTVEIPIHTKDLMTHTKHF